MAGRSMAGLDDLATDIYERAIRFELEQNGVDLSLLKRGFHGDAQRRELFHSSSDHPATFWVYSGIPDLAVADRRVELRWGVDRSIAIVKEAIEKVSQETGWDPVVVLTRGNGPVVRGLRLTSYGGQGVRRVLGLLQAVSASCLPHTTLVIVVPTLKSTPLYLRNGVWVANRKATRTQMAIPAWTLLDRDTPGRLPEEVLPLLLRLGAFEVLAEHAELCDAMAPVPCACCWADGRTVSRGRRTGRRWGHVQHAWSFITSTTVAQERLGVVLKELELPLAPHGGLALVGHGSDRKVGEEQAENLVD